MSMLNRRVVVSAIIAAGMSSIAATSVALAQTENIATYRGEDRQAMLEAGAKEEGALVWYSSAIVDQAIRPIIAAFEEKYPYISVDYVRDDPPRLLQRVTTEVQAGNIVADVLEGLGLEASAKSGGLVQPFWSPSAEAIPAENKDPEHYWVPSRYSFIGQAYNTNLVDEADLPKTFEGLLDPKWKGKMAWGTGIAGAPLFVTGVLQSMGEEQGMEYLRKLAEQEIVSIGSSQRAVLDRVIAGEYPLQLDAFLHHPIISAEKGAPVKPLLLSPVLTLSNSLLLTKEPPHPHAAMLFIDFLLSEEGQSVFREAQYFPSNPNVSALPHLDVVVPSNGVAENIINPETLQDAHTRSQGIVAELFE